MNVARGATLVAVLTLGALVASCSTSPSAAPEVPDGWTTHTVGDVTFSTPAEWKTEESAGALVVRAGTDETDAMASVVLVPEPRPLKVEADAVFASMVAVAGATRVSDGPVDKAGATEAFELEYVGDQPRADGDGTFAVRSRWVFMMLDDGSGVIAAVNAPEDQFDEDLETVLESVTLP